MGLLSNYFDTNTSEDYKNAYQQSNQALQNQKNLNAQYAGNAGYNNAINQGLQGAAVTAGQAGQQATQAARNAGMTKGRAANLGASQAANAYGNNFANQQGMAMQSGQNAINANQAITSGYGTLANQALNEQNARFNRAGQAIGTIGNVVGNIGQGLVGLLSDENMKNIKGNIDHISELAEQLDNYFYTYKNPDYPGADDKAHIGTMAQQLEECPVTADAVNEDSNGIKHVDGGRLALDAIALISDMSKRISELEGGK